MDKGQESLTYDEIWDDSVLIDSWNDALNEYKVREGKLRCIYDLLILGRNIIAFTRKAARSKTWTLNKAPQHRMLLLQRYKNLRLTKQNPRWPRGNRQQVFRSYDDREQGSYIPSS